MRSKATILVLALTAMLLASYAVADRAIVIKLAEEECALFDGDGNLVFNDGGIIVITNSQTGRKKIQCTVKGVANSSGKAVHFDTDNNPFLPGLECGLVDDSGNLFLTTDWKETVSASGNAVLTCKFKDE